MTPAVIRKCSVHSTRARRTTPSTSRKLPTAEYLCSPNIPSTINLPLTVKFPKLVPTDIFRVPWSQWSDVWWASWLYERPQCNSVSMILYRLGLPSYWFFDLFFIDECIRIVGSRICIFIPVLLYIFIAVNVSMSVQSSWLVCIELFRCVYCGTVLWSDSK